MEIKNINNKYSLIKKLLDYINENETGSNYPIVFITKKTTEIFKKYLNKEINLGVLKFSSEVYAVNNEIFKKIRNQLYKYSDEKIEQIYFELIL
jgi:hypothetical protein